MDKKRHGIKKTLLAVICAVVGLMFYATFPLGLSQDQKDELRAYFERSGDSNGYAVFVGELLSVEAPYMFRVHEVFKNESDVVLEGQTIPIYWSNVLGGGDEKFTWNIGEKYIMRALSSGHRRFPHPAKNHFFSSGRDYPLNRLNVLSDGRITYLRELKAEYDARMQEKMPDGIMNILSDATKHRLKAWYGDPKSALFTAKLLQAELDKRSVGYGTVRIDQVLRNNMGVNPLPDEISIKSMGGILSKQDCMRGEDEGKNIFIWAEKQRVNRPKEYIKSESEKAFLTTRRCFLVATAEDIEKADADIVFLGKIGKHVITQPDKNGDDVLFFDILKVKKNKTDKILKRIAVKYNAYDKYGEGKYGLNIRDISTTESTKLYWLAANKIPNTDYYDAELIGRDFSREIAFLKELQLEQDNKKK